MGVQVGVGGLMCPVGAGHGSLGATGGPRCPGAGTVRVGAESGRTRLQVGVGESSGGARERVVEAGFNGWVDSRAAAGSGRSQLQVGVGGLMDNVGAKRGSLGATSAPRCPGAGSVRVVAGSGRTRL